MLAFPLLFPEMGKGRLYQRINNCIPILHLYHLYVIKTIQRWDYVFLQGALLISLLLSSKRQVYP